MPFDHRKLTVCFTDQDTIRKAAALSVAGLSAIFWFLIADCCLLMSMNGHATLEGTTRYRDRVKSASQGHFRLQHYLWL
jgi:hypothetical protein